MNLTDLKPRQSKLKISTIKEELTLNPITLSDEAWLSEVYNPDELQKIFSEVNIKEISRIVFRLMNIEGKKIFKKQSVDFVTEDGEVLEQEIGGVELLRNACVGWEDKLALLNSLIDNMGISRPDVSGDEVEVGKKKVTKKKKK